MPIERVQTPQLTGPRPDERVFFETLEPFVLPKEPGIHHLGAPSLLGLANQVRGLFETGDIQPGDSLRVELSPLRAPKNRGFLWLENLETLRELATEGLPVAVELGRKQFFAEALKSSSLTVPIVGRNYRGELVERGKTTWRPADPYERAVWKLAPKVEEFDRQRIGLVNALTREATVKGSRLFDQALGMAIAVASMPGVRHLIQFMEAGANDLQMDWDLSKQQVAKALDVARQRLTADERQGMLKMPSSFSPAEAGSTKLGVAAKSGLIVAVLGVIIACCPKREADFGTVEFPAPANGSGTGRGTEVDQATEAAVVKPTPIATSTLIPTPTVEVQPILTPTPVIAEGAGGVPIAWFLEGGFGQEPTLAQHRQATEFVGSLIYEGAIAESALEKKDINGVSPNLVLVANLDDTISLLCLRETATRASDGEQQNDQLSAGTFVSPGTGADGKLEARFFKPPEENGWEIVWNADLKTYVLFDKTNRELIQMKYDTQGLGWMFLTEEGALLKIENGPAGRALSIYNGIGLAELREFINQLNDLKVAQEIEDFSKPTWSVGRFGDEGGALILIDHRGQAWQIVDNELVKLSSTVKWSDEVNAWVDIWVESAEIPGVFECEVSPGFKIQAVGQSAIEALGGAEQKFRLRPEAVEELEVMFENIGGVPVAIVIDGERGVKIKEGETVNLKEVVFRIGGDEEFEYAVGRQGGFGFRIEKGDDGSYSSFVIIVHEERLGEKAVELAGNWEINGEAADLIALQAFLSVKAAGGYLRILENLSVDPNFLDNFEPREGTEINQSDRDMLKEDFEAGRLNFVLTRVFQFIEGVDLFDPNGFNPLILEDVYFLIPDGNGGTMEVGLADLNTYRIALSIKH